jgi:hypothetical protein
MMRMQEDHGVRALDERVSRAGRFKFRAGLLALVLALVPLSAGLASPNPNTAVEDGGIDNGKATHGHDVHHQHGGSDGHVEVDNYGVDLISKLELSRVVDGKIADVGVHNGYAYLAAWGGQTCDRNGVHIVDIRDVDVPREVGFIPAKKGSYPGEGVQALSIDTTAFAGDILVTNNEMCKVPAGFGGMNIYDVTDPENWTKLAVGFGDYDTANNRKKAANQIHSVFAWQAGDKAYAVMVDNEEFTDVDIVDITDPAKPVLIAEYDLAERFPQILEPDAGLDEVFLHDMIVKEIAGKQIMLLSYWDGGYIQMDVTDPTDPVYLADSDFGAEDSQGALHGLTQPDGVTIVRPEGNAHQAEFTRDNRYVIGADEDFSPFAAEAANLTDSTELDVSQGSNTTPLEPGTTISGDARFFGRGCNGDAVPPDAGGSEVDTIAVVERGSCTFTEKVANVTAAGGYEAVVIFNAAGTGFCDATLGMSVAGDLPTFGVAPRGQGLAMFDVDYDAAECLAGTQVTRPTLGQIGDELNFASYFDGWGYVRLFDAEDMEELDTYAVPEAVDEGFATGFGDLSVHEVATSHVDDRLAYLSYYSAGLRVIDVDDGKITEVGAYIDDGGNNFWGVEVFESGGREYVAASDRDFGLYIFEYAPESP